MRHARRIAPVAALVMMILLTPLLISLKQEEFERRALLEVPDPASQEVLVEPPPRGKAEIRLLGVNDFHGNLERTPESGGAAYLAAQLDRQERENPRGTIRVHAGDMVGASPLVSANFHDEPTVHAMNEMGFDVGTLGNHEFDEGEEEMLRLVEGGRRDGREFTGAEFPYVAANTVYRESGRPVLPPYEVLERDGVRVGFIGVTTLETPEIIIPDAAEPFRFPDISETVNRHAATLRARGVEAIVVLAHSGALDTDRGGTANEIVTETTQMSDSVDVVFSGHTHNRLVLRVSGKLVVQSEEYGNGFGAVDLEVGRASGEVTASKAGTMDVRKSKVRPDQEVAALVDEYRERVAPVSGRVVGSAAEKITTASTEAGESALGDFVADGQKDLAGADFAFVPTGGLRTDITAGPVTYGELFAVQPSGRDVVRMELSGEQVRRALEKQFRLDRDHRMAVSGLRYAHDPSRPLGDKVTSVTLPDGSPLDPDADYAVAVNGFLAAGGGDFRVFTEGRNPRTVGTDVGALARHARELPQPFVAPDPVARPRVTLGQ